MGSEEPARALSLSSCEPGFAVSSQPVWVIDMDAVAFCWANQPALELWNASEPAELFARDMVTDAPERVLARLRNVITRVRAGEHLREEWAFYPRGQPIHVLLDLRAIELPDGRVGMLNQVVPMTGETSDSIRRALTIARHLSVIYAFVDADGRVLSCNQAALDSFGELDDWSRAFVEVGEGVDIIRRAHAGQRVRARSRVVVHGQQRWHAIEAEWLRDPVSGDNGVLLEHRDETARVEAESLADTRSREVEQLDAALRLVERQRNAILELSAPILDVGAQTLAVPIIGEFGAEQSDALAGKLLDAVVARGARRVILDLTGIATIDPISCERLQRLVRALRLVGAQAVLTGIRPEVARSLASLLEPGEVPTMRSLATALSQPSR